MEESRQNPHVNQASIGRRKNDIVEQHLITEYVMLSLMFLNEKVVLQSILALQMMVCRPAVQWLGEPLFWEHKTENFQQMKLLDEVKL